MVFRLFLFCLFLISFNSFSQKGKVEGRVFDQDGKVIYGATVIFKSETIVGVQTDENGFFTIELPFGVCQLIVKSATTKTDTLLVEVGAVNNLVRILLKPFFKEFEQINFRKGLPKGSLFLLPE